MFMIKVQGRFNFDIRAYVSIRVRRRSRVRVMSRVRC